jgi:hypothetical protein
MRAAVFMKKEGMVKSIKLASYEGEHAKLEGKV